MIVTLSDITLVNTYLLGIVKVVLSLLIVLSGKELTPRAWRNAVRERVGMHPLPIFHEEAPVAEAVDMGEAA